MMERLFIYAEKLRNGSVNIYKHTGIFGKPATFWLNIDEHSSIKPDYRHKYITLNCYKYAIFWIRNNYV